VHLALAIGGALQGLIVDGYKSRVAGELQISLDKSGAQSDCLPERGQGVFRRVARSPAMPDNQHYVAPFLDVIEPIFSEGRKLRLMFQDESNFTPAAAQRAGQSPAPTDATKSFLC
jgi:hypothetical protein